MMYICNMENLRINKAGYHETDTHRQCTNCKIMFEKTILDTMSICSNCNTARVKCMSAEYKMRNRAQQRAKKECSEFNLIISDIIIPANCPVFNVPLITNTGKSGGKKYSPSLDRINPEKGYTKDNIQVISHLANQMKSHADEEELIAFAKWVLKTYTGEE